MRLWILAILIAFAPLASGAKETIPPVPTRYFNDYANVVSAATVAELNTRLETFEKETSSQVVVAIYPKMESDSSIQDYTVRVAQAWRVGQKEKRNGAVLFMFIADRKMFLQVGYGLEGAIPDAVAKQITEFEIKPRVQQGDYDGGLRAGVNAILQAARGEYKGTGRTVAQQRRLVGNGIGFGFPVFIALIVLIILAASLSRSVRGGRRHGRRRGGWVVDNGGWTTGGWGGGWTSGGSGGSWGGGGDSGGGSFSSGGGDFGGGGAGSSW